MKLPQHPALPLLSVALLGYLCGDVACAVMERQFNNHPQRQPVLNGGGVVALNGIKNPGELSALLNTKSVVEPAPGSTPGPGPTGPGQPVPPGVPNATLPLPQLAGTLEGQGQSLAVLQVGQETQVVGVGEEWMGYKVVEVGAFQARLKDARNQEYTVSMALANVTTTSTTPTIGPVGPGNGQFTNNTNPVALSPVLTPYKTSRELRADLENKGAWIQHILVKPMMRDGDSIGVQINYNIPTNPFARLGIQTGDVVLSLNAKPARGTDDLSNILMELRNATTLNFQIERGGQQIPLQVNLEP